MTMYKESDYTIKLEVGKTPETAKMVPESRVTIIGGPFPISFELAFNGVMTRAGLQPISARGIADLLNKAADRCDELQAECEASKQLTLVTKQ
jgi:hypothetical protein